MADNILITGIGEWLVDQALSEPDIIEMFNAVSMRLYAAGVPVARARVIWPTLHPLFQAETILWRRQTGSEFEQFRHESKPGEGFLKSPLHFMAENNLPLLRRNLDGPNKLVDFPVLEELVEQGFTDYLTIATAFDGKDEEVNTDRGGLIVSWSSDRPGGFSDDDVDALQKIQRRFAVACKTAIQSRITGNIVETYLGKQAGRQVLDGAIKRGDGQETQAVVWFSDLRDSTALADTMASDAFFDLLNDYYECTAGSAIRHGGEVLDFIGDAVLAIFPYETDADLPEAVKAATQALKETETSCRKLNAERVENGLRPIRFGVGLNTGKVMFGNIGVAERLTFSVIGPTVNQVERIETMTKAVESQALVTKEIAAGDPDQWVSTGMHRLVGLSQEIELFAPKPDEGTQPADAILLDKDTGARVLN